MSGGVAMGIVIAVFTAATGVTLWIKRKYGDGEQ
jgi:hypothetical protein